VARDLFDQDQRAAASGALVETLLALHATDVDEVGLGDLGRRTGYVERQLRRWSGQLAKGSTRDLPLLVELGERLAADVPAPQAVTIVHGDYRLDNLILSPDGSAVRAVLDWELCTLGDPLADIGMLHVYWAEAADAVSPLGNMPTVLPGFWTRDDVLAAYAAGTTLDLSEIDFYVAFAYWRIAIILEGVHQRFAAGAYEHDDAGVAAMGEVVHELAAAADDRARAVGR
jgi:aminoglycoside phosphotransferase (APT) family kinase protein